MAQAVHEVNPELILVGLANSQLIAAGQALGMTCAQEFFADRNYTDAGQLVPRTQPDAMVASEDVAIERVIRAVKDGAVLSNTGKLIELHADTLCVHGDSPSALAFVQKIRAALEAEGIAILPVGA